MTTLFEKLQWLAANTCSFNVDVNDHRSSYQTVESFLEGDSRYHMEDDVRMECIRRGTLVLVQVYPDTPVGFISFGHYDLEQAVGLAYECVQRHR